MPSGEYIQMDRLRWFWVALVVIYLLLGLDASAAPEHWFQVNDDGFFGHTPSQSANVPGSRIFTFGSNLYGYDNHGLYRMQLNPCLKWEKLVTPSLNDYWILSPIGDQLYLSERDQLWFIRAGEDFSDSNWIRVTSIGPPSGVWLVPMTLFNNQIYAAVYSPGIYPGISDEGTFSIWRSQDIDKPNMQWSQVVSNSFSDPQNHALAFMPTFNNKIMAVTTVTRTSFFGDPSGYGDGIEIWESASGDPDSWAQVNEDGFGTETTLTNPPQTFRTNQDAGCWAEYKDYLYIGTLSHWGAEVWRYDGTGLNGWTKVTPGPCENIGCDEPGRCTAMIEYDNNLYLSEGFPLGSLEKYDGTSWTEILNAKDFDVTDSGFTSLAKLDNKLYLATLHDPRYNPARGDQVWGYPFISRPNSCPELGHAENGFVAIDPMALILHGDAYLTWVEIHHPRGEVNNEIDTATFANYVNNIVISRGVM